MLLLACHRSMDSSVVQEVLKNPEENSEKNTSEF
jgi:hypothetical protein